MENLTLDGEYKILKAINEVFTDYNNKYLPVDEKDYFVYCPCKVNLIEAKSDFGKKLLLRFLSIDENGKQKEKKPVIEYAKEEVSTSKFSLSYLNKILSIFDYDVNGAVKITLKKDYPITIENDDFKCILAPRIEA
jgi:hypothetical protein